MTAITRRRFIQGLGAGTAAIAAPGLFTSAWGGLRPDEPSPSEMRRILTRALERGGQYADLFLETRANTQIQVSSSEISSLEYGVIQGGGVRTVAGEKMGYAYAESFDAGQLEDVATSAARIAEAGGPPSRVSLQVEEAPRIVWAEKPVENAPVAEKIALVERVDRAARAVSPDIMQVTINYADSRQRFTLANTEGQLLSDDLPLIYLRVTAIASRNGKVAQGMFRISSRAGMEQMEGGVPEEAGRGAAEQAVRMLEAQPAPTGEMPVVVAAGGGVVFHEAVGHGLEADAILRGTSVFTGRVGEKVATDLITLYDDASMPRLRGSYNVDDEGVPAQKTVLIEKGQLVGYMHSRRTAYNMRANPTGNGRRQSFRHPAIVRMSNTCVAPGRDSADEIIKSTRRGIYAAEFGGGEVDTTTGQFTFGLREAYLIEDGKLTAPIEGANLVGSGPEVLKRIDRVASDFGVWPGTCGKGQWVPVTSGCPTLRVSALTVGGTA